MKSNLALVIFCFKHLQIDDDGFNLLLDKEDEELLKVIQNDLGILITIKKHSFLDLSVLADYDISEFDEYYDDWHDTTNELDRKEFELLKRWLDNEE